MELMDALRNAIQDWIIPELDKLHLENAEIRATLGLTNKRIEAVRDDLVNRIETVHDALLARTERIHDDLMARVERVHDTLNARIGGTHEHIDGTNKRIDRLYEVIVRRDEHVGVEHWVRELDRKMDALERRLAA